MKITIAKTAGFCMGVRRAVDMVLDAANKTSEPICTYGPLIHNPQVLNMLKEKGIPVMTHIPLKGEGTVLIRAHGVPPVEKEALKNAGFTVINATCPKVIRVQTIIRKHAKKGFATIIVGDNDHPEVKGLMGYASDKSYIHQNGEIPAKSENSEIETEIDNETVNEIQNAKGYTVSNIEELASLPRFEKAIIVAQTTQDTALYKEVKKWIVERYPHYKVFDTICDSTEKRQEETRLIAQSSDAVIVVGGKDSGNTRRLAQIAADNQTPFSIHIEDISELNMQALASAQSIAITAGASTPNWIINQTCRAIEHAVQKNKNSPKVYLHRMRDFMLRSNFLLAAGAGSLTYACSEVQKIDHNIIHAFVAMLYVLSMQILNNLFSIKSDRYNNIERAEFYDSNKIALAIVAVASGGAGLALSFTTGILPFIILGCMSILGLLYNQKVFPDFFPCFYFAGRRIMRIKDIPGSKTILIAVAWGTVTSVLPALSEQTINFVFLIPFIFASTILFSRTAFFSILEIQGDRITGKETIPLMLGEKKSKKLIQNMLLLSAATFFIPALFGLISESAMLIATIPLLMLYVIKLHEKGKINSGMHLEFIVESHFILAGIITIFF